MTAAELSRLAADLELDVLGAAAVAPYDDTEQHIRERKARGLFADMRFTMARPEISCHPETPRGGSANCRLGRSVLLRAGAGARPGRRVGCPATRGATRTRPCVAISTSSAGGSVGRIACSSTRTTTSTARLPFVPEWRSTGRTRWRSRVGSGHGSFSGRSSRTWRSNRRRDSSSTADRAGSASTRVRQVRSTSLACSTRPSASRTGRKLPRRFPSITGPSLDGSVYGCDICQDVCPWNRGIEKRRRQHVDSRLGIDTDGFAAGLARA